MNYRFLCRFLLRGRAFNVVVLWHRVEGEMESCCDGNGTSTRRIVFRVWVRVGLTQQGVREFIWLRDLWRYFVTKLDEIFMRLIYPRVMQCLSHQKFSMMINPLLMFSLKFAIPIHKQMNHFAKFFLGIGYCSLQEFAGISQLSRQ